LRGGVMLHLDEVQRDEKQRAAKRRVEKECEQVRSRERSRSKKFQRQHRIGAPCFHDQKNAEEKNAAAEHSQDPGMTKAHARRLDQPAAQGTETEGGED